MAATEAQKAAKRKYNKKVKRVLVELSPVDQDIIDFLETSDKPAATTIKEVLRKAIKNSEK